VAHAPKLLVCDLDNTLYDWVAYFVASFYAMVDVVVKLTGCDRETLLDDLREVHRKYHDSEHPFSLLETKSIIDLFPGKSRKEIAVELDEALHAFNSTRKKTLRTHPFVHEVLATLRSHGIQIVAHSESKLHAVVDRLRRLSLVDYFALIYCRERTNIEHPYRDSTVKWPGDFPMAKVIELSHHQQKPDPSVLLEICSNAGVSPSDAAYVGDSIARDILMAREADVFSIWAAYGARHDPDSYEKLVRISHWTVEDVEREKWLTETAASIKPDFVAENSFTDILYPFGLSLTSSPAFHAPRETNESV
jgi:FMN phosphatase YigB (HAD superfamily)